MTTTTETTPTAGATRTTIGVLVPEFPGQTHIFFWREMQALRELGVRVEFVSTRRPPRAVQSHAWAEQAAREAHYLFPLTLRSAVGAMGQWLRAGPGGWWRCVRCMARADGATLKQKVRLVGLYFLGAELAWWARQRGWSHVHVHSCADSADIALLARQLSGLRYSLTLHGPLQHYRSNQRQKWANASFAIVVTQRLAREVRQALGDALPPRVEVAAMGVDARKFVRRTPYRPCGAGETCRVFTCGRLHPGKGHQDLIRAVALLRERGVKVELHVAGEDEKGGEGFHHDLARLVAELKLEDCVHLLGAVSEERVVRELEAAHVFALGSHNEAIGVAIMEAMAMQVPVVVTDVGGVRELVDEGVDGLFVRPGEPGEMAEAIARLVSDPALAARLSANQRPKIESRFHQGVSAQIIARLIGAEPTAVSQESASVFRFCRTHPVIEEEPSPCPLPEYRERGKEGCAPAEPKDPEEVAR